MNASLRTTLFALTLPLATAAMAQSQAPIEVEADRLDLDQRAGTAVYSGNVDIRQGEMQLRGERVEIQRNDAGELSQAIATGERAYLRNRLDDQETPHGRLGAAHHLSRRRTPRGADRPSRTDPARRPLSRGPPGVLHRPGSGASSLRRER